MLRKVFNEETKELFLYNEKGELIFKRWVEYGYSKWFDVATYDKHTYTSITDEGIKYNITTNG